MAGTGLRVAILFVLASHAAALSWDGVYYVRARLEQSFIHAPSSCVAHPVWCVHNIFVSQDPDELKITLSHSGTTLNAHTQDWEISGTITSSTHASLAGLEGTLSSRAVTWSNGVVWSREQVATPVAPPTWPGTYHAARAGITIKIMQPSDTKVIAEGTRYAVSTNAFILFACTPILSHTFYSLFFVSAHSQGKKAFTVDGRISGNTIKMFDIEGRLRNGYSSSEAIIDWTNGEQWTRGVSTTTSAPSTQQQPTTRKSPPPPPLLAACCCILARS